VKLYLDIDGVLLTKNGALAEGAETFLQWAIDNHEPHWLSTRTRDGSSRGALRAFHGILETELVRAIQPVRWATLKTEALPVWVDGWAWVDDEILHAERAVLVSNDALDRFVQISVNRNPTALLELPEMLRATRSERRYTNG
jgi:hypothetical protein